jgi:hypothetical protein
LGPLSTAATNRPIVLAPGDYDDGEIGGIFGQGIPKYSEKICPSAALSTTNLYMLSGHEPGPPRWEASD